MVKLISICIVVWCHLSVVKRLSCNDKFLMPISDSWRRLKNIMATSILRLARLSVLALATCTVEKSEKRSCSIDSTAVLR